MKAKKPEGHFEKLLRKFMAGKMSSRRGNREIEIMIDTAFCAGWKGHYDYALRRGPMIVTSFEAFKKNNKT